MQGLQLLRGRPLSKCLDPDLLLNFLLSRYFGLHFTKLLYLLFCHLKATKLTLNNFEKVILDNLHGIRKYLVRQIVEHLHIGHLLGVEVLDLILIVFVV